MSLILVCGLDTLGIAVTRRLAAEGNDVRVLASAGEIAIHAHELRGIGVRAVAGTPRSAGDLEAAGLGEVSALILSSDDDAANVDAALSARRLRPGVPIVARIFDPSLAHYLEDTETGLRVMSVSGLAAPRYAELAQEMAKAAVPRAGSRVPGRRWRGDPFVVRLVVVTLAVTVVSVWYFSRALGLSWLDALYFVVETVTNTGYGDVPVRAAGPLAVVVSILLMIVGAGLLGLAYALLAGWFVARRLDVLQGRVPERGRGHVVVAGAGNVGFRVAQLLAAAGRRVVVIERHAESRNLAALRAERCHVVVADAALDDTLEIAGVERAAALLVLTDSDAVNLKVALATRQRGLELPIVIRLISPDLSDHLHGRKGIVTVSPIAVAAEAFAKAARVAAP